MKKFSTWVLAATLICSLSTLNSCRKANTCQQKTEEVIDYIEHIRERYDQAEVHAFREKFMSACDGHATDRIMDLVHGK